MVLHFNFKIMLIAAQTLLKSGLVVPLLFFAAKHKTLAALIAPDRYLYPVAHSGCHAILTLLFDMKSGLSIHQYNQAEPAPNAGLRRRWGDIVLRPHGAIRGSLIGHTNLAQSPNPKHRHQGQHHPYPVTIGQYK